jgi:hypothetical protein
MGLCSNKDCGWTVGHIHHVCTKTPEYHYVLHIPAWGEWFVVIDCEMSYIEIMYCPWCGKRLGKPT